MNKVSTVSGAMASSSWAIVCERKYDHYSSSFNEIDKTAKVALGATDFMDVFSREQNTPVLLDLCDAIDMENENSSTRDFQNIKDFTLEVRKICALYKNHTIHSPDLTINIHRLVSNIRNDLNDKRN